MKVLVFKAGTETFALDIKKIQKLVESPELFPIPLAPPFFKGAVNFHNHITPVLDFAAYLEIFTQEQESRVVILDLEQFRLGLSVSSLENFTELEEAQTLPGTSASVLSEVSRLVTSHDGETIRILDLALLKKSLESGMASKSRNAWYFSEPAQLVPDFENLEAVSEQAEARIVSPAFSLSSEPQTGNR